MLGSPISDKKLIKGVGFEQNKLCVTLSDGRMIATPLEWYPRLEKATDEQRNHWEAGHSGIHWPDVDEDLSIDGMLNGRPSIEYMKAQHENDLTSVTSQPHQQPIL